MSLKSRLLALLVSTLLLIALAISAVDLNGLVATFLDSAHDRVEFTAQQVKTVLLQRLNEASGSQPIASVAEARSFWLEFVSSDPQLPALLERTMAPSKVIVEISIARDDGTILASSNPSLTGRRMASHPGLNSLQAMSPIRRFLETIQGQQDYEVRVPVGRGTRCCLTSAT